MSRPTRILHACSTMMLAVLGWFARVGARLAAMWRRPRDKVSPLRRQDAPIPAARVAAARDGELVGNRPVFTRLRVTEIVVTRRIDHAGQSN